jgi:hypothetical protein
MRQPVPCTEGVALLPHPLRPPFLAMSGLVGESRQHSLISRHRPAPMSRMPAHSRQDSWISRHGRAGKPLRSIPRPLLDGREALDSRVMSRISRDTRHNPSISRHRSQFSRHAPRAVSVIADISRQRPPIQPSPLPRRKLPPRFSRHGSRGGRREPRHSRHRSAISRHGDVTLSGKDRGMSGVQRFSRHTPVRRAPGPREPCATVSGRRLQASDGAAI